MITAANFSYGPPKRSFSSRRARSGRGDRASRLRPLQYHQNVRGKWLLTGGILVVLALGVVAVFLVLRSGAVTPAGGASPQAAGALGGPVLSLPARVEASEVVSVPVPVEGIIESLPVDIGTDVFEGELLATIRSSMLESRKEVTDTELNRLRNRVSTLESALIAARLEAAQARESAGEARASVETARKALERQQLLFSKGAAAKQSLEKSQAAYKASAEVSEARQKVVQLADSRVADLNRDLEEQQRALDDKNREQEDVGVQVASGEVRSPVNGYVVARKGAVGQEVTLDVEDLFQIAVNLTDMRAVVDAPPAALEKVHAGQEAVIQIAELPDGIAAKVAEVQEGQAIIQFTNPSPFIKPGITARVTIKLDQ